MMVFDFMSMNQSGYWCLYLKTITACLTVQIRCGCSSLLICQLGVTLNWHFAWPLYFPLETYGGTCNNALWCKKNGRKGFKSSAPGLFVAVKPSLSLTDIYPCLCGRLLWSAFCLSSVFFRVYRKWETPRPDSSMRPTFQIASEDLKQTSILHHESTQINDLKGVPLGMFPSP